MIVNIAADIYAPIKETADYARVQAAIATITNLIVQEAFPDAENATSEAQTFADNLYQLAAQNRATVAAAELDTRIAIAQAEVVIQRAQILNASQHAPKVFQEASSQLQRAGTGIGCQSL